MVDVLECYGGSKCVISPLSSHRLARDLGRSSWTNLSGRLSQSIVRSAVRISRGGGSFGGPVGQWDPELGGRRGTPGLSGGVPPAADALREGRLAPLLANSGRCWTWHERQWKPGISFRGARGRRTGRARLGAVLSVSRQAPTSTTSKRAEPDATGEDSDSGDVVQPALGYSAQARSGRDRWRIAVTIS